MEQGIYLSSLTLQQFSDGLATGRGERQSLSIFQKASKDYPIYPLPSPLPGEETPSSASSPEEKGLGDVGQTCGLKGTKGRCESLL